MKILALNCGSSSVKYQLFDWQRKEVIAKGMVERVTIENSFIVHEVPGRETYREEHECPDHKVAVQLILKTLVGAAHGVIKDISEVSAVGHRVVHGGEKFASSVVIDDAVLNAIKEMQHLAPLHNPPNIAGIEAAQAVLPTVPHVAIFDTAFHHLGVEEKIIEKSGAWYAYEGERMGQGRENARQFLKDNTDIRAKIDAKMRKSLGLPVLEHPVEHPKPEKAADVLPMPEKKAQKG
jgi:acetate kinase